MRGDVEAAGSARTELSACENLSQLAGWLARWTARIAEASGVLVWTPDPTHPLLVCAATSGEPVRKLLRRTVLLSDPLAQQIARDRQPVWLGARDLAARTEAWIGSPPAGAGFCGIVPVPGDGVPAVIFLFFPEPAAPEPVLKKLQPLLVDATPAFDRALKTERKTAGMRQAIERLTALYDLSKAFGSTIDLTELDRIIATKAADFAGAEVASLWLLGEDAEELILAETVVNENYSVENPPAAVGASSAGDVLADRRVIRLNGIAPDDPMASEENGFPVRSLLAVALLEEERPVGVLTLANKRGRHPEFSAEDEELITDLGRQAVRALHNARQYEAEKKVEELDALLTISREITATLDIDKVMRTVVNGTAALISYDRCMIAIMQRGKLRLGAVSGVSQLDRKDPKIQKAEALLEWVYFGGSDLAVARSDDGSIEADRPETQEKFRTYFEETSYSAFYAVILRDEEGRLGVLSFESRSPLLLHEGTRGLLDILVNQATVAVRNAQLYKQVPLAGFWKPVLQKQTQLLDVPRKRRLAYGAAAVAALVLLFVVPWRLRSRARSARPAGGRDRGGGRDCRRGRPSRGRCGPRGRRHCEAERRALQGFAGGRALGSRDRGKRLRAPPGRRGARRDVRSAVAS